MNKNDPTTRLRKLVIQENDFRIQCISLQDAVQMQSFFSYPLSLLQAQLLIQKSLNHKEEVLFGIYLCDHLIGILDFYHIEKEKFEIGYRMMEQERGKGHMKHALSSFLEACPHKIIEAHVHQENEISRHLLEILGFQLEQETYRFRRQTNENQNHITG